MPASDPVRIERAQREDIPALIELLSMLFAIEGDFSADRDRQRRGLELLMSQPDDRAVILVARGDAAVGMASAQLVISTAEGAASAWIEDVVVRKSHQRRGIARLLLAGLTDWARRNGATRVQLLADSGNAPALDFYGHLGWQPTQLMAWRRFMGER